MSDLIWLSEVQMRRIEPYFPLSHGVPRVDDRRIIRGIVFVLKNGCVGAMRRPSTDRPRQFIIGSSGGAAWACSTRSSRPFRPRAESQSS